MIRVAIAAASTCVGCVCIFGRSYGPSHPIYLSELPAGVTSVDDEKCQSLCGGGSQKVEACAIVTMGDATKHRLECAYGANLRTEFPEEPFDDKACAKTCPDATACKEVPAGPAGEKLLACLIYRPGGCDMSFGHGRRSRAVRGPRSKSALDRMAEAEAASVLAFRAMARELQRFGAPASLVRAALRSAREEREHAEEMIALGARRPRARTRRMPQRSLYAFARENLREGVVGETIGAAFLRYAGFSRIAREEQRHAALSLRVHRWAIRRLTVGQRERLLRTQMVVGSSPLVPDDVAATIVAAVARHFASAPSKNTASSALV